MLASLSGRLASISTPLVPLASVLGSPPARTYMYERFQKPILLKKGESLAPDDERNFQPVAPIPKWETTSANHDPVVAKFVSVLQIGGKRELANDIIRRTFAEIKYVQLKKFNNANSDEERSKIELNPTTILKRAVVNCTPILITQLVKRGGVIYNVPFPPRSEIDAQHRGIKYILEVAKSKASSERMWTSLSREIIYASNNDGKAVRKKQDMHKSCEENRAYATFRKL